MTRHILFIQLYKYADGNEHLDDFFLTAKQSHIEEPKDASLGSVLGVLSSVNEASYLGLHVFHQYHLFALQLRLS